MTVALYTHADMLDHRPGEGHPERLKAVLDALGDASDLDLEVRDAPLAEEGLLLVHPQAYIDTLFGVSPGTSPCAWTRTPSCRQAAWAPRLAGARSPPVRAVCWRAESGLLRR